MTVTEDAPVTATVAVPDEAPADPERPAVETEETPMTEPVATTWRAPTPETEEDPWTTPIEELIAPTPAEADAEPTETAWDEPVEATEA
jgi:hypothetical protein